MNNIKYRIVQGARVPADNKNYWLNQLQEFVNYFAEDQVKYVEFGKQDSRGIYAITLLDHNNCVPKQRHFMTFKELLAFVAGHNAARSEHSEFGQYARKTFSADDKTPVRYFVWNSELNDGGGDIEETDKYTFAEAEGRITCEHNTIFAIGVYQICLTRMTD